MFLACLATACATGGPVVREDWVVVPGQNGKEILTRADYLKVRRRGFRAPNVEAIPPPLLSATSPLTLRVGEVKTYLLMDEPVSAMRLRGDAVEVFWTKPYRIDRLEQGRLAEHTGSDVHLRGRAPGRVELELELTAGGTRTLLLDVRPRPAAVGS